MQEEIPNSDIDPIAGREYFRLFLATPIPIYIFDVINLKFLNVNQAALEQYGYSREEFLKLKIDQIRPNSERITFMSTLSAAPKAYHDYGNWLHLKKNGEEFYAHVCGYRANYLGQDAIISMAVNNDGKRRAELELLEKTEEVMLILESITDAFYAINEKSEITYFNKEAERIKM